VVAIFEAAVAFAFATRSLIVITDGHDLSHSGAGSVQQLTAIVSEDLAPIVSAHQPPGIVKGDWVLFHPVYTPKELTSVEVSALTSSSVICGPDFRDCW
jgi:hypothetical protein